VIDSARNLVGRVRRIEPLVPGLLFVAFVVAFVGLAGAAGTRSPELALACVAAVVATLSGLAAWTLVTDRRAQYSTDLPRHVAWDPRQWAEFERAFWSYVGG
jgi:hypothetical protein